MVNTFKKVFMISLFSVSAVAYPEPSRADLIFSDVLEVVNDMAWDLQRSTVKGVGKIVSRLQPEEKKKLQELMGILNQLLAKYEQAALVGGIEKLTAQSRQEIAQLTQQLALSALPMLIVLQNPEFIKSNEQKLNDKMIEIVGAVKRTLEDISNEL